MQPSYATASSLKWVPEMMFKICKCFYRSIENLRIWFSLTIWTPKNLKIISALQKVLISCCRPFEKYSSHDPLPLKYKYRGVLYLEVKQVKETSTYVSKLERRRESELLLTTDKELVSPYSAILFILQLINVNPLHTVHWTVQCIRVIYCTVL